MRSERATVFHLHDGKVTELVAYLNHERVLAHLALAPENGAQALVDHCRKGGKEAPPGAATTRPLRTTCERVG
jgi:hypothetical protein